MARRACRNSDIEREGLIHVRGALEKSHVLEGAGDFAVGFDVSLLAWDLLVLLVLIMRNYRREMDTYVQQPRPRRPEQTCPMHWGRSLRRLGPRHPSQRQFTVRIHAFNV
jgi:hypothetical protein